ncbi:hypothetical protein STA3757_15660 [Stanieria sp. NIES-3757]|nr:hypothetical protein STA3757_15660 [Stanieria sp. NIES-3757]
MAIIALKAWYLEQYEPIKEVIKKPHHLRLSRNSLLKSGLRVDFLDDRATVEASEWFARYLEGESIEFYIEGSGNYLIANIDLVSQEIYFAKQETLLGLEPVIYLSPQREYPQANEALQNALESTIEQINTRSRYTLTLEVAPRANDAPVRLSSSQLRKIRKSLLFIADGTPIASVGSQDSAQLLLNSNVCVEIGYALETKDPGQILLTQQQRPDLDGQLPFDFSQYKQLSYKNASELNKSLPKLITALLQRFSL